MKIETFEKTFCWKTPKGNIVDMTIEIAHTTEKDVNADGHTVTVPTSEYKYTVLCFAMNGEKKEVREYRHHVGHICYGYQGKDRLMVAIPAEIMTEIKKAETDELNAKYASIDKAENEYQAHCDMMKKAMQE